MHYFYPPTERRLGDTPINYDTLMRMDPHKKWAEHAYNEIVLRHICGASKDAREMLLAEQEILIARRKQQWWETHPQFDPTLAERALIAAYRVDRHGNKAA